MYVHFDPILTKPYQSFFRNTRISLHFLLLCPLLSVYVGRGLVVT